MIRCSLLTVGVLAQRAGVALFGGSKNLEQFYIWGPAQFIIGLATLAKVPGDTLATNAKLVGARELLWDE